MIIDMERAPLPSPFSFAPDGIVSLLKQNYQCEAFVELVSTLSAFQECTAKRSRPLIALAPRHLAPGALSKFHSQ